MLAAKRSFKFSGDSGLEWPLPLGGDAALCADLRKLWLTGPVQRTVPLVLISSEAEIQPVVSDKTRRIVSFSLSKSAHTTWLA